MAKKPVRRLFPRRRPQETVIGLAWYLPEQWERLRKVSADADKLEDTHGEWLELNLKSEQDLKHKGLEVHRVIVDVDALFAWCEARNQPVNGASRSDYVGEMLRQSHQERN